MENEMELVIMELITNAGDARSLSIEAIREGKKGNFPLAIEKIKLAEEKMNRAHEAQTSLIFSETSGNPIHVSLLMVHAQDHVMNAMTVKDLAKEMIDMMIEAKRG